jgi:CubicO group peptidase (beta-lactamase class C family)
MLDESSPAAYSRPPVHVPRQVSGQASRVRQLPAPPETLAACATLRGWRWTVRRQREYWPTTDWKYTPPERHGLDPAVLAQMHAYAQDSQPPINALVVVRHGYIVFEAYYHAFDQSSYFSAYSITKSILSALVGVALEKRYLRSLDQRLLEFFPEYDSGRTDPRKSAIALRHVLSMTTGFDQQATDAESIWRSEDIVMAALGRPMAHDPGQRFFYDDVSTHLLSIVLTRLTGMSTAAFAYATLFNQLGMWRDERAQFGQATTLPGRNVVSESARWPADGLPWTVDRQGYTMGAFGLHLTAREMAKFGYLYVNGGWWDGSQVIPSAYVAESTQRQSAGGPPVHTAHGYLWWIPEPHPVFFAAGIGGQTIHVIPGLDLVVAITASSTPATDDRGALRRRIIEGFVLPALGV